MVKFLYKINAKYDGIVEPFRFVVFMSMMVPAIILQATGEVLQNMPMFATGWLFLLLMLTVRMLYISGAFNSGKQKTIPVESNVKDISES